MKMINRIAGFMVASLLAITAYAATPLEQCFSYNKAQDYLRAVQAGREAVRSAPQSGDTYWCLGKAYDNLGDLDLALKNFQQAERLYRRKDDLASVYSNLGHIAKHKGDLQQALNYYSRALGLDRELGNRSGESAALSNIAGIFHSRGDLDKALDYFQQSLNIEPAEASKGAKYNNIALVYSDREEYLKAVEYLDKAIAIHRRYGNYHGAARTILNKGSVQIDARKLDDAEASLNEGLAAIRKVGDQHWEAVAFGYLGQLAEARGQLDLARNKYQEALQLARAAGATNDAESYARKIARLKKDATTVSYGVVEIGSKGVKAAVVTSFIDDKGRSRYETGFKKSINTDVLQGVTETGEFTAEAVETTAKAASDLIGEIRANAKNVGDNIFIAGSSALSSAMNRGELGRKVQALTGTNPMFINSAQELVFAMVGSIPEDVLYKTALLDIGSGNGRIGYLISPRGERKSGQAVIDLRAGSVSLTELVNKSRAPGESYIAALNRVVEKDIAPRFVSDIKQYPVLSKHHYLMVVGGAAWAMATLMHPEDQGAYVPLTLQDFRDYAERLANNPDEILNPDLSRVTDTKVRETAAKQVAAVKKTFSVENLQSGARTLKLVADTVPLGKAEVYFNRDGNWAYGMAAGIMASRRTGKN